MEKKHTEVFEPEWSHKVRADHVEGGKMLVALSPDEEQCKALLRRLSIDALENVTANLSLRREGQVIAVLGHASATVTQSCVITLEPVVTQIEEEVEAWFADPEQAASIAKARRDRDLKKGQTEVPILEERDDPEAIMDGQIDLGELVVQFLSLGINLYPQAEGAMHALGDDEPREEPSTHRKNPFAALKDWKDNLK